MFSKITLSLLTAAALTVVSATFVFAGGDDAIKARQACMKANGAGMGVMVPIIKGEKPYDAGAVAGALDAMGKACADWNNFWPADSMTSTTLKTHALEAIWKDPKAFEAAGGDYYNAEQALLATKDEASFKAAFPALGKGCGGCHEKFRGAMN
jgi:cytochrome c556